jgi:hypothetical protein
MPAGTASCSPVPSAAGRVLGYGTLVVGPLEIEHVPKPREVTELVERLAS